MRKIGYIRVSTQEQNPDRQITGLRDLCDELHIEKLSAAQRKRPVFDRVIRKLQPGDRLVVWDLDRAFRSARDALNQIERLRAKDIEIEIANLFLDTSTPAGKFVYTMMSALAEFERQTLIQRTKEGLEAAKQRGQRLGRPPKLSDTDLIIIERRLKNDDETITAVAKDYGVDPWTVTRSLRRTVTARSAATAAGSDQGSTPWSEP